MMRTLGASFSALCTTTHLSVVRASPARPQARRSEIVNSWRIFNTVGRLVWGLTLYPEGDLERFNAQIRFGQELLELGALGR